MKNNTNKSTSVNSRINSHQHHHTRHWQIAFFVSLLRVAHQLLLLHPIYNHLQHFPQSYSLSLGACVFMRLPVRKHVALGHLLSYLRNMVTRVKRKMSTKTYCDKKKLYGVSSKSKGQMLEYIARFVYSTMYKVFHIPFLFLSKNHRIFFVHIQKS